MSGSCGIINLEDSISKIECYHNISKDSSFSFTKDSSSRKIIVENFSISENNTIVPKPPRYYGITMVVLRFIFGCHDFVL
jgi:hypothetical protein